MKTEFKEGQKSILSNPVLLAINFTDFCKKANLEQIKKFQALFIKLCTDVGEPLSSEAMGQLVSEARSVEDWWYMLAGYCL